MSLRWLEQLPVTQMQTVKEDGTATSHLCSVCIRPSSSLEFVCIATATVRVYPILVHNYDLSACTYMYMSMHATCHNLIYFHVYYCISLIHVIMNAHFDHKLDGIHQTWLAYFPRNTLPSWHAVCFYCLYFFTIT